MVSIGEIGRQLPHRKTLTLSAVQNRFRFAKTLQAGVRSRDLPPHRFSAGSQVAGALPAKVLAKAAMTWSHMLAARMERVVPHGTNLCHVPREVALLSPASRISGQNDAQLLQIPL